MDARAVRGKGASSALIRDVNERRVLSALRRLGPATIADVAAAAYVLPNTTWRILEDLGARGLVMASGRRAGGRGMPASLVRIDPDGAYALGHFVGRDRIETALMDLAGQVRAARSVRVAYPMPDAALATIAAQRKAVEAEVAGSLKGQPVLPVLAGLVGGDAPVLARRRCRSIVASRCRAKRRRVGAVRSACTAGPCFSGRAAHGP